MFMKLVVVVLIVILIYFLFFKKLRKQVDDRNQIDDLIQCPKCGTFFTKKEGVLSNGKHFCSKECLK